MSIFPKRQDGFYDENGVWQRTKFCFVQCPADKCTCHPPFEPNPKWHHGAEQLDKKDEPND